MVENIKKRAESRREVPILDLSKQHESIRSELDRVYKDVMDRDDFIMGKELEVFEANYSGFCETEHCVGVGSGTDALHLALRAAGVGEGDQVITVPFTFTATAETIMEVGAEPVFVDIDPDTYCMDIDQLEEKLDDRTRAVIPVHMYGLPANMSRIQELTEDTGTVVIEDACQAHGALWKEKTVGGWGDLGCFSFYPAKNLGALGDAGAVVTPHENLAQNVRRLRDHGREGKYTHVIKGCNSRLDNLQAGFLNVKLKHITRWNELRRERATTYLEALEPVEQLKLPMEPDEAYHVYHQFTVLCNQRDALKKHLETVGIDSAIHYPTPLHLQPAYHDLPYEEGDFPVSERVSDQVLSIPCFPEMTDDQQQYVIDSIQEFFVE